MRLNHKSIFIYLLLIHGSIAGNAQQFDFCKTLPADYWFTLLDMEIDEANNILLAGYFEGKADFDPGLDSLIVNSYNIRSDYFMGRYTPDGSLIWAYRLGDPSSRNQNISIALGNDNDFYASFEGLRNQPGFDFDPGPDTAQFAYETAIAKYELNGDFQWVYGVNGKASSYVNPANCEVTSNGDVVLYGYFRGPESSTDWNPGPGIDTIPFTSIQPSGALWTSDHWLARYSKQKELSYLKSFFSFEQAVQGRLEVSSLDEIYVTGWFSDTIDVDFGPDTTFLNGKPQDKITFQWNRYPDMFVCKYDSSTNLVWAREIEIYSRSSLVFSNTAPIGTFYSMFHDFRPKMLSDDLGNLYYALNFSDTLDLEPDVIGGEFYSRGSIDILLTKLDTSGNFVWAKQIGGIGNDRILDIQFDHQGNLLLAGHFTDSLDLDPGIGITQVASNGNLDVYFASYDIAGNLLWGHSLGGPGNEKISNIRIDGEGSLVLAGVFQDSVDFDIDSAGVATRYCEGMYWPTGQWEDAFFAKYRQCPEPQITEHPQDTTLCSQDSLQLRVAAAGIGLSYQWYANGTAIAGATDSILSIPFLSVADSGSYYCEVSLGCAFASGPIVRRSDSMILQIQNFPQLLTQPTDVLGCTGDSLSLQLTAQGTGLTYQWYQDFSPIPGADSSFLSFTSVSAQDTGSYFCEINGGCGPLVNSRTVSLQIIPSPQIEVQPQDTISCLGETAGFEVQASGSGLMYQWIFQGQAVGGNQSNLVIPGISSADTGQYYCIVTGACAPSIQSRSAYLNLGQAPIINSQPQSIMAGRGDTVRFSVSATGDKLQYQWLFGNTPLIDNVHIVGSQTPQLEIRNVQDMDRGFYSCRVTGACLPPSLSTLAQLNVGSGDAIEDNLASQLKVYPNPSSGIFHVEGPPGKPIGLRVIDGTGKELVKSYFNTSTQLDLSAFADGTYLLIAEDGSRINLVIRR